jgi:fructokinase
VVVGEVLFDVFPDGSRVLGGAPFNVAWHLQAFDLNPFMVTRVGDDAAGEEILAAMAAWGMDREGVQIDSRAPTGQVRVELDRGSPTFTILSDQAYDRLDGETAVAALAGYQLSLLYHGSLIARTVPARESLAAVRDRSRLPAFVDVNLRDPWWTAPGVEALLDRARWIKLNDDELERLTGGDAELPNGGLEGRASTLARLHRLAQVVVTRGDRGALVCSGPEVIRGQVPHAVEVVDTVGAGDAFSAVWIAGLLAGWRPVEALPRALEFAAAVCTVRGATSRDRDLYDGFLDRWEGR